MKSKELSISSKIVFGFSIGKFFIKIRCKVLFFWQLCNRLQQIFAL